MGISFFNHEWYASPTEYEALTNIEQEEKSEKYVYRPIVYICSPYSGSVETNTVNAKKYSRFAVDNGYLPITPHIYFTQFMNDSNYYDRKLALTLNYILLNKCTQLWVFGDCISPGMQAEIRNAKRKHKRIRYFNRNCKEVSKNEFYHIYR